MEARKVVLKMVLSLDGFATSPDGTHDWMFEFFDDAGTAWSLEALEEAGVHAMGRRSYEIMGPHWMAADGPIAQAMNTKPKAVLSTTLERPEWGPVEVFADPVTAVADLKAREEEGTILVHGGPGLARSLTRLGLVDEYRFTWIPIMVGQGRSPFADLEAHLKLDVVDEHRFSGGSIGRVLVPRETA